ncbi:hypothetical protein CRG98_003538 [Punica granatum]|uniref:Retrovirus-related Pol polyprotein from transposon TNT 1-94-like beta-barrel domain-containing protein n=1 Tax=Punica granatum TaxID=22663 RepID=A0A2I0L7H3_PUNGR|nr:hypothetical protein CRG98_003538 [Punica granatum]
MESYLLGHDLLEIVGSSETRPPTEGITALRKWKIKAGKAMFAIKVSIEEDMLEHIRCCNHMTGDQKKFRSTSTYRGDNVIVLADNTKLPNANIGKAEISPKFSTRKLQLRDVYCVPAEKSYLDEVQKNKTADMWHVSLGLANYRKLKVMMSTLMLKELPQLEVHEDMVYLGCQ